MRPFVFFATVALASVLSLAPSGADQMFWTLSSGPAPSPYPSPTAWPVDWYGSLYFPITWPICAPPNAHHCRPRGGHVWPPAIPPGKHAMPGKPPAR